MLHLVPVLYMFLPTTCSFDSPPRSLVFFFVSDIEDLPPAVQEKLFDEVLDRDVQKGEIFTLVSFMAECHGNAYHMLCAHMEAIERAKPDVTSLETANRGRQTITGSLPSCGSVILLVFSLLTAQWSACLKLLCQMSTFVVYTTYVRPNQP